MHLVGNSLLTSGVYIRDTMGIPLSPEEIVERLLDGVVARVQHAVPWCPGARELLLGLKEAGVPCGLVTMSYQRFVAPILAHLPPETFRVVVTGDQVDQGKPHPEPYLTAAAALGVRAGGLHRDRGLAHGSDVGGGGRLPGRRRPQPCRRAGGGAPYVRRLARRCHPGCAENVAGSKHRREGSSLAAVCSPEYVPRGVRPPTSGDCLSDVEVTYVNRKFFALVGAGTLAVSLAACGDDGDDGNGGSGDAGGGVGEEWILGTTDTVTALDPAGSYDLGSSTLEYNLYQTLVTVPANSNEIVGDAAE